MFYGREYQLDSKEILDVLFVTGGVPRYLEEVDPTLSADENIRRMCFSPDGYLFREFNELFNDIVSRAAPTKKRVLEALAEGPLSGALSVCADGSRGRRTSRLAGADGARLCGRGQCGVADERCRGQAHSR